MDKYNTGISSPLRIRPRRSHSGGIIISNSGNSNVIINMDGLPSSRNNRFPDAVDGSPGYSYHHVVSEGNGGSPNSAGSGNPVYIQNW